jgi:hypothetical protein
MLPHASLLQPREGRVPTQPTMLPPEICGPTWSTLQSEEKRSLTYSLLQSVERCYLRTTYCCEQKEGNPYSPHSNQKFSSFAVSCSLLKFWTGIRTVPKATSGRSIARENSSVTYKINYTIKNENNEVLWMIPLVINGSENVSALPSLCTRYTNERIKDNIRNWLGKSI